MSVTSKKLRDLQAKKLALVNSARAITDGADASDRDLSADEAVQFDGLKAQIDAVNAAIARETALMIEEETLAIKGHNIGAVYELSDLDDKRGFKSFGDFATAVKLAGVNGRVTDDRLGMMAAAPSTFGSEASGVDGGFLIPPEFSRDIFTLSLTEDSLLPLTDNTEIGGNSMVFPKDETTPWGTDGVRAYWQAEASAATATKPKLGTNTLRLNKLMSLVPLTDELLSDTTALDNYLPGKMAASIRYKVNEALLFGNGNGQPLGVFNGAAAVTQAKDTGQATQTVSVGNITGMISKLIPGCYPRSMWMIAPDAMGALMTMTLGGWPIWLPSNQGAQSNPYGMLLGRPMTVSQHASAFSSLGDILLIDPTYIRSITKSGGIQTATSMHLYFDADATAFRATFRVDAQPKIAAPVTQAKGSNSLSAFIQLAAR